MITDKDIITLLLTKGLGPKSLNSIIDKFETNDSLDLVSIVSACITRQEIDIAREIQDNGIKAESLLSELKQQDIKIIVRGRWEYPKMLELTLRQNAPPVLFAKGNIKLLNQKAIGFCGSRKASEKGINVAAECATELSRHGINVVSGYAQGVDLAAHKAALESGGTTTFVLAEGILKFKLKQEIKDLITDENYVVISQFLPKLTWLTRNAMQRNKTICGLSNAVVIIESGLVGGTFEAGKAALELKRPLFVLEYAHPPVSAEGNIYFIRRGAKTLRKKNGHPYLEQLFHVVENDVNLTPNEDQLILTGF